jgi:hypothetical protein
MKELPKIAVRLEDTWPATALNPLLGLQDETPQEWGQQKDTQNLAYLKNSIGEDHESLRFQRICSD